MPRLCGGQLTRACAHAALHLLSVWAQGCVRALLRGGAAEMRPSACRVAACISRPAPAATTACCARRGARLNGQLLVIGCAGAVVTMGRMVDARCPGASAHVYR
jgi:hypothetical protein